jgi:rod shape-determining protein MreC
MMARKGKLYPGLGDWVVLILVVAAALSLLLSPDKFRLEASKALRKSCFYPLRSVMYFSSSTQANPIEEPMPGELQIQARMEHAMCREALLENERLRSLLDFVRSETRDLKLTQVIGRNPDRFGENLIIAKGDNDDVFPGQAVLGTEGLIGVVTATDTHESVVKTWRHDGLATSGMLQETRQVGILRWNPAIKKLNLSGIPLESEVGVGDVVITSGYGRMFPKGIPIGEVISITDDPQSLTKIIQVLPYVDLDRVEEVFLLTHPSETEG